jgi:acyl-CoA thioester hydrolase
MALPLLTPLDIPTLRARGVPAVFRIGQADRVRFHELDALDHVNNAVYLSWFETFRVAYMRDYGIAAAASSGSRPVLVLRNVDVEYRAPLHLDEVYIVTGRSMSYRRTSWKMQYAVVARGQVCALGHAVIVLMEADAVTRKALPQAFVDVIVEKDGAVFEG